LLYKYQYATEYGECDGVVAGVIDRQPEKWKVNSSIDAENVRRDKILPDTRCCERTPRTSRPTSCNSWNKIIRVKVHRVENSLAESMPNVPTFDKECCHVMWVFDVLFPLPLPNSFLGGSHSCRDCESHVTPRVHVYLHALLFRPALRVPFHALIPRFLMWCSVSLSNPPLLTSPASRGTRA